MARPLATLAPPLPDINLPADQWQAQQYALAKTQAYALKQTQIGQYLGEIIGRRQMGEAISQLVTVTTLLDARRIKETKAYVGYKVNESVTITTWEEACRLLFGKSVETIDLQLKNLDTFGQDLYEAMESIGIGPGRMRDLRKIPADARAELLLAAEAAASSGSKAEFVETAEALLAKHARDTQLLETQIQSLEKAVEREKQTGARIIEQKNQKIDELDRALAEQLTKPTEAPDWDSRVNEGLMQVTILAGLLLQQADKLGVWRESGVAMAMHLPEPQVRAFAVDYMAKMEQILIEVTALVNAGHDAFGGIVELARMEGTDYKLSDLPPLEGFIDAGTE